MSGNFRNMCAECGGPTDKSWQRRCTLCYQKSASRTPVPGSKNLRPPTWRKQQTVLTTATKPKTDRTCRRCPNHIQPPYHYCTHCYRALSPDEQDRERQTWPPIPKKPARSY